MPKFTLAAGGVLCLLSVVLGAFAAHGLKAYLSEYALAVFTTGVTYQMYHGLALVLVGLLMKMGYPLKATTWLFLIGCLLFSGSLYMLALTGMKWFGPITPIGGTLFILGWGWLITQVIRFNEPN